MPLAETTAIVHRKTMLGTTHHVSMPTNTALEMIAGIKAMSSALASQCIRTCLSSRYEGIAVKAVKRVATNPARPP